MVQLDALSTKIGFATDGSQYLTFQLGEGEYGIEILKVQEIKGYTAVTPIPNTPPCLKGVMNLRGTIVPGVQMAEGELGGPFSLPRWLLNERIATPDVEAAQRERSDGYAGFVRESPS